MPTRDIALEHRDQLVRLGVNAAAYANALWRTVDRNDIARSWIGLIPSLAAVLTGAQRAAAGQADPYLDALVPGSTVDALVSAAGFAGVAADGRDLLTLLFRPVIVAKTAVGVGSDVDRAMAGGAANLDLIVRSEVADAGRVADQVAITARPEIEGYIRVVVGDTCSRCIILAGRWYPYSAGFRRHPRCDCVALSSSRAQAAGIVQDPRVIYDSLTAPERTAAGWSEADQKAIAEGADINQVTNARRGIYTAGGRRYTTEGTSRRGLFGGFEVDPATGQMRKRPKGAPRRTRLTPDQIFQDAGDRDEAIRLLRENGYLTATQPATPRSQPTAPSIPEPTPVPVTPPPRRFTSQDIRNLTDEDLFDLFGQVSAQDDPDEQLMGRLIADMDRRERGDNAEAWLVEPKNEAFEWSDDHTPEQQRLDALLEQGEDFTTAYAEVYGLDVGDIARQAAASTVDRRRGENVDQAVRRSYDEWVHVAYTQAEDDTRGNMLNKAGKAAGVDPRTLFSGPLSRARKYASEELMRWWRAHDRLDFTQFKAQVLHRDSDIAAAQATRLQSNDRDFL